MNCTNEPIRTDCVPCDTYADCEAHYSPEVFRRVTCSLMNGAGKGCTCYMFFGFSGEDCSSDFSTSALGFALWSAVLCFALYVTGRSVKNFVSPGPALRSKAGKVDFSKPYTHSLIGVTICSLCYIALTAGYLLTITGVDAELTFERRIKGLFVAASVMACFAATMTICIAWCDMGIRSKTISKKESKTIKNIKKASQAFTAFFFLSVVIIIVVFQDTTLASFLNALCQIVIVVSIAIGGKMICRVLDNASRNSSSTETLTQEKHGARRENKVTKAAKLVGRLASRMQVYISLNFLFSMLFAFADTLGGHNRRTENIIGPVLLAVMSVTTLGTMLAILDSFPSAKKKKSNEVAPSVATVATSSVVSGGSTLGGSSLETSLVTSSTAGSKKSVPSSSSMESARHSVSTKNTTSANSKSSEVSSTDGENGENGSTMAVVTALQGAAQRLSPSAGAFVRMVSQKPKVRDD